MQNLRKATQMLDIYVARQPIFDRDGAIYGYELLFRDGPNNAFPNIDGSVATSKVLSNTFLSSGIDFVSGGKRVFINFTRDLLLKGVPHMFPKSVLTVEVLEDVKADSEIMACCAALARNGYEIALDDFVLDDANRELLRHANIVKIDFRAADAAQIRDVLGAGKGTKISYLAEKVETRDEYETALSLGFDYFQGYFFTRPEIIKGRDLAPSRVSMMSIMAEASRAECSFDDLEGIFNRDVSIAYKLLRYINSAYFRRVQEISSIRQAISLLGQRGVQQFTALLLMSEISEDQPSELLVSSIVRARLCEQLADHLQENMVPSEMFSLGLFSLIDVILQLDIVEVMGMLPLPERLKEALVLRQGVMSDILDLAVAQESADWGKVDLLCARYGINPDVLPDYYADALGWADSLASLH